MQLGRWCGGYCESLLRAQSLTVPDKDLLTNNIIWNIYRMSLSKKDDILPKIS